MRLQGRLKKPQPPFSHLPNEVVENSELSWKAKGILLYLNGRPPGWQVNHNDLVERSTDGRTSIESGVKELQEHGLLKISSKRGGDGRIQGYTWCLFPENKPDPDYPHLENPDPDNPDVENPQCTKKGLSNKSFSQKEYSTNGSDSEEEESEPLFPKKYQGTETLARSKNAVSWLKEKIEENHPKADVPDDGTELWKKWVLAFCRMVELDEWSFEELNRALQWGVQDEFWSDKILSAQALRSRGNNGQRKILNLYNAMNENENQKSEFQKKWERG